MKIILLAESKVDGEVFIAEVEVLLEKIVTVKDVSLTEVLITLTQNNLETIYIDFYYD